MPSARFYIIGDAGPWIRTRVQEEINHLSLNGTTLAAGKKTTAVSVEGDKEKIIELRENLRRHTPNYLLYTRIDYSEDDDELEGFTTEDDTEDMLRKIWRKLEEIEIKLDAITETQPSQTQSLLDSDENGISDFFNM